jgi:hypothetical protein
MTEIEKLLDPNKAIEEAGLNAIYSGKEYTTHTRESWPIRLELYHEGFKHKIVDAVINEMIIGGFLRD